MGGKLLHICLLLSLKHLVLAVVDIELDETSLIWYGSSYVTNMQCDREHAALCCFCVPYITSCGRVYFVGTEYS